MKLFHAALLELGAGSEITTIVDLFGGSGLLAHTAKRHFQNCRVVYNDYDNYEARLNSIDQTNEILERLRKVTSGLGKDDKICRSLQGRILDIIGEYECKGFVDYITLSSSLLFSQNYVQSYSCLQNATLYNKVKKDGYNAAGYLEGLEVVRKDYKALFGEFSGRKDVLFLVDPPYLSTDTSTYMSENYWRLNDYLDVLLVLMKDNYVYFTSNKSQIIELCDWLVRNYGLSTPFNNAAVKTYQVKNHCCKFTDMMYYKKYESER